MSGAKDAPGIAAAMGQGPGPDDAAPVHTPAPASASRKPGSVRALTRGLAVLRHVNGAGAARPADIARALGLPRPTVHRLVDTLEEEGYLARSATGAEVRVTRRAAALGDGFARDGALLQSAGPVFAQWGARLVWPLDLTVYDDAAMVVQETTHGRSPLSIDRAMSGYRLPMLRTSAGRAYLAFCDAAEREAILAHLRRLGDPADAPFLDPAWLSRLLADTRARGLALRDAGEFRPQTASIAAPVLSPRGVLGCVSMIWIRRAMTGPEAVDRHGAQLRDVAAALAAAAEAAQDG
ncbi:DNA-binding transcriptional regulator [Rhodovulum sp. DZ06]|uniref:DNA-binding transcriptional regulator n=1 Tax=Rhodovulum sp. DZ06 TaxID=3425126 RepID=UPI003D334477